MSGRNGNSRRFPVAESLSGRLSGAFALFSNKDVVSSLLLLLAAGIALGWVNVLGAHSYHGVWNLPLSVGVSNFLIEQSLHHWINDGLMSLFFFYVGLEIKREVLVGELSSPGNISLPVFAAIGGMAVPALLFTWLHWGQPGLQGWGIPMATDIAFSLGILMLLGKRVPAGLKIFLTAFAIVDDLGAVMIIAFFYSSAIDMRMLLFAGGAYVLMWIANMVNVRRVFAYGVLALAMWYFVLNSGIHPTVAGILAAFAIPVNNKLRMRDFVTKTKEALNYFRDHNSNMLKQFLTKQQLKAIDEVENNVDLVQPPLQRMEYALDDFVSFLVMPLFALANAGVVISGGDQAWLGSLSVNILISLLAGKAVGIFLFCRLAVGLGLAALPKMTNWWNILGVSFLGGIGFTMALFIANLAYGEEELLTEAKLGILIGSLAAGLAGFFILKFSLTRESSERQEEA